MKSDWIQTKQTESYIANLPTVLQFNDQTKSKSTVENVTWYVERQQDFLITQQMSKNWTVNQNINGQTSNNLFN